MIEIPEAEVLKGQLQQTITGKRVAQVIAAQSPHKFAWFSGDPGLYAKYLMGTQAGETAARGGIVEVVFGGYSLTFSDGVNLQYHPAGTALPARHQLLLVFDDGSALSAVVLMYGGLLCEETGRNENPYYRAARLKPNPLTPAFDGEYFHILTMNTQTKLPLKAFLATEQRIPGLGNGVLQDILYNAALHPRLKLSELDGQKVEKLFISLKETLIEMAQSGGRNTESDLFGITGGYLTKMSRNTLGKPCPVCGTVIVKEAFLGGSVYFCPECQKI